MEFRSYVVESRLHDKLENYSRILSTDFWPQHSYILTYVVCTAYVHWMCPCTVCVTYLYVRITRVWWYVKWVHCKCLQGIITRFKWFTGFFCCNTSLLIYHDMPTVPAPLLTAVIIFSHYVVMSAFLWCLAVFLWNCAVTKQVRLIWCGYGRHIMIN